MRKFILSLVFFGVVVSLFFFLLLYAIPVDKNAYLCEYEKKIELIEKTPSPRLILAGASQLAMNIDSKRIADNMGFNVINMGLNGGIGARYCLDDYLNYIRKGDVVVLSLPYDGDFLLGGNGTSEVLTELMVCTHWRNFFRMNIHQMFNVIEGIPFFCYRNIKRWEKASVNGWDSPSQNEKFIFVASGFNEYGDEISHWTTPPTPPTPDVFNINKTVVIPNEDFIIYLKDIIKEYEKKGAIVLIMPTISSETYYQKYNPAQISKTLESNGMQYITNPKNLIFNDSLGYAYTGDPHFNRKGVVIASDRISKIIKGHLQHE